MAASLDSNFSYPLSLTEDRKPKVQILAEYPNAVKDTSRLGFGEADPDALKVKHQDQLERIKKAAMRAFLGIQLAFGLFIIGLATSTLIPVIFSAVMGAFVLVKEGLTILRVYLEKKDEAPSTHSLNLNAKRYGAPELNTISHEHSVMISEHGQESMEWKIDLLRKAKQSIELSGNFCGGLTFRRGLANIRLAMQENTILKTRILLSPDFLYDEDLECLKTLKTEFGDRFNFLISDRKLEFSKRCQSVENHVKLLIIDEKYFMAGGTGLQESFNNKADGSDVIQDRKRNFAEKFLAKLWRDKDMLSRGPLAKTLRLEFFKLYAKWEYKMGVTNELVNHYQPIDPFAPKAYVNFFEADPRKIDHVSIQAVVGSPSSSDNNITKEYCKLLKNTKEGEKVYISNMLFNPCPELYKAISEALDRGVKIDVITNGMQKQSSASNHLFCWPHRLMYYPLMKHAKKNNLRIFEFGVPDAKYHDKTFTVGNTVCFSSYNFGRKSHYADDELSLLVHSPDIVKTVSKMNEKNMGLSVQITKQQAKNWQGIRGLLGRIENLISSNYWG